MVLTTNQLIYVACMAVYCAAMIIIGFIGFGKSKTVKDFFVYGRLFGWVLIAFSWVNTYTSMSNFIGHPGMGYRYGLPGAWLNLLALLVVPITIILFGTKMRVIAEKFESFTVNLSKPSGASSF